MCPCSTPTSRWHRPVYSGNDLVLCRVPRICVMWFVIVCVSRHVCGSGNLVVSMRPMTPANAVRATELTARFPRVHGSPVHIGDPVRNTAWLNIKRLTQF
jgi:hypothetical protein